jgi:hypothetical protein
VTIEEAELSIALDFSYGSGVGEILDGYVIQSVEPKYVTNQ